jgi:8-oxo-dGTP pyrophosphatase MutT (NUDIX family)
MFLSHFDPGSGLPPQWVFPGGGLEKGEEPLDGVIREVFEETGKLFSEDAFIQLTTIWHEMDDKRIHDTGEAHFFELRVSEHFEPSNIGWTENEHRDTVMHRWLSLSEILSEKLWIGPQGAIELLIERYGNQEL